MNYFLILVYLCCFSVFSQNPTAYNPEKTNDALYKSARFVNTGQASYSIKEIILDTSLVYSPLLTENHSVGFTSDNYWIKFRIENTSIHPKTYYLETARPITDVANLYQITPDSIWHFRSGDQIPFHKRQVNHRSTVFKVKVPSKSIQPFYLHLKSDGETINLPLNLYTESEFLKINYNQQLFLGLFYGLLVLAGIIYLFFYVSLKERSFLYYGLYVFSIALLQAALDGLLFEFIWTNGGYINSRAVLITALSSNFFLLKYCEYFLKINEHLKPFKKYFNVIYVVLGILFVNIFINSKTFEMVYPISNVNGLISLLLILLTVIIMRFKRIVIDPFFVIGIFFLVIGLLGFVMNNLSLLPNNFYTLNSAKFGAGLEVVFLSLSMTNLIRKLRGDKEKSQALALKKSEEISELKTYFMSNMSHELRTPINAILGIAQDQLENSSPEKHSDFEIIKNASISLLSNINDILDFEKIEKDELILKDEIFNPLELLQEISNNWKLQAEKKGLNYETMFSVNIPDFVKGDGNRFCQIINNVLSNAVKFTQEGTVKLELQCIDRPNNISRFAIQISDTGVGIPDDLQDNVFDSFSQMRNDNKRQFGGIGLGLTIVNYLVNRFKGKIQIESKSKLGTNVFIDLPFEVEKQAIKLSDDNDQKSFPIRVLVVEDNAMNQMIMKKLLANKEKFKLDIAANGLKAIEMIKTGVFDVVLMDLQMPVMDGYEATKIIRQGKMGVLNKDVPIIAITADAMPETRQTVLDLGMNDYMTKPVNKNTLIKKIDNYTSLAKPA